MKTPRVFYCVYLVLMLNVCSGQYEAPSYLKTKYGSKFGAQETFTKTKSRPLGTKTGSYGTKTGSYSGKNNGGCDSPPPAPINGKIFCSMYGSCKASCLPDHQFPLGVTETTLQCENGLWIDQSTQSTILPDCLPTCLPACQNNGICVGPNQCICPDNFLGPQCQYENKPCLNFPPMPMNSRRTCRANSCTITCAAGHEFPDGSNIAQMECKDGLWVPAKNKWLVLPDCQATCNPACLNGGNCLSYNVCQCPQDYRGPQCQYPVSVCSTKSLQFNGAYNCSGDSESFRCSVTCPEGMPFEFPPAPTYDCFYSSGGFQPSPIPQCIYPLNVQVIQQPETSYTYYTQNKTSLGVDGLLGLPPPPPIIFNNSSIQYVPLNSFGVNAEQLTQVQQKLPKPGSCFTWGGRHYKTFDGRVFSFDSKCTHILLRNSLDNTFTIIVQNSPGNTHRIITFYLQDKEFQLKRSEEGQPIFVTKKKVLPIPGRLPGIRVEMSAHYVVVSLDTVGVNLQWDGQNLIHIEVRESLWNRTEGLCGQLDGDITNDVVTKERFVPKSITTVASSWKVDYLEASCDDTPTEEHACFEHSIDKRYQAAQFCNKLLSDQKFAKCSSSMDLTTLLDICKWDYCSCKEDPEDCACQTINILVKECAHQGIATLSNWRDEKTCPMKCRDGKIYHSCRPSEGQASCGSTTELIESDSYGCGEGCYCPTGTVLHEGKCITRNQCPCRLRGRNFAPGTSVLKDCNTCTCNEGLWVCTQVSCGARCSAIGDPHYQTFDGKRYDFMGQCTYRLVQTPNFTIDAENVACAGSISLAMNLPASVSGGLPSCTKTVTITVDKQVIKLKQNHDLVVNGLDVSKIPFYVAGVTIRSVSSIFLVVELPGGVEVWWDGVTRVYIDVPSSFQDQTKGLCGTFNKNQKDDFLTPESDVEQAVIPFANKWKTSEKCNDIPDKLSNHPCDLNIQNKQTAENYCQKLKSDLFKDCHWFVDPEEFYQNCLYDMCACEFKVSKCLCPTLASYASECTRKGIKIDWRNEVRECGIHCPGGQKYQVCGNSCTRTCSDVSLRPDCRSKCVEGCNCPEGEALDANGECIPIGQCPCQNDGLEFPAGYKEVRPASKGPELCTCINAAWRCTKATDKDNKEYPKASDLKAKCNSSANFEFTTCESIEPVTCKNMHSPEYFTPTVCHAGCQCKEGHVLDTKNKKCVKPKDCPCHHGGKSYSENATVQADCNTCKCTKGKWECSHRQCSADCSAWGDSHFKTFDGKHFDYQGQCDYVLAKGAVSKEDSFDVTIQNVPCGSLGTSCSKSVTIRVHLGDSQQSITLTRDKHVPQLSSSKLLTLREKGLFVMVEAPDLGISLHWDKGTRVYVKLDPRWKTKIKGLCGNYNDDDSDDFQTPSGGLVEASSQLFGDSWKLQSYCPEAQEITNTCEDRPERKVWALKKCGILKSQVFSACHSEVPLDNYFDKCVFDTCACDQGGDCECLCTALAAYAQECNNRGVPIKWRTQQLCPMQCDETCSKYSPCISTCPTETCDNLMSNSKLGNSCVEDSCVEGCSLKTCPPDQVFYNSSFLECVPRNVCKPFCMEVDSITYYEGDKMEEDDCHTCFCSREKKSCVGQPCPVSVAPQEVVTQQNEQLMTCKPGWTSWINQDKLVASKSKGLGKKKDLEPLPTEILLNNLKNSSTCRTDQMIDIQCRTVRSHLEAKKTGLNVDCSLERGLVCKSSGKGKSCPDFEIRVKCSCEEPTSTSIPIQAGEACDLTRPHQEHPTDCHLFYHCEPTLFGSQLVKKTCGWNMMFNPVSMVCDWPSSVLAIKPNCKDLNDLVNNSKSVCPPGEVYDSCALSCDNLCLLYSHFVKLEGKCKDGQKCEAGCVPVNRPPCPSGMYFADYQTCVAASDCMCYSNNGTQVKPGVVYQETECKSCQCVDNSYFCHEDGCLENEDLYNQLIEKEMSELGTEIERKINIVTLPPIIIPSTVTPPEKCPEELFVNLIEGDQPLGDEAFSASSVLSPSFAASHSRLDSKISSKSGGSWAPEFSNENQYLQINLPQQEPVYGVIVRGSPLYDEYVTSYKVLYSPDDNVTFYYVLNEENHPQIFRGSIDASTPVKTLFEVPFEAKAVRINPQTWNNGISLRVELVGCGEATTTQPTPYEVITVPSTTLKPKLCEDSMGWSEELMADQQVKTSSDLSQEHNKYKLKLSSDLAWQPLTNSPIEFVEFDFLEPRNLTGIQTKGGPNGWVTSYSIKYSSNNKDWNPIIEGAQEKLFLGNVDGTSLHKNEFEIPIQAQYLKIVPTKWQKNIQLRVEVLGCFKAYPAVTVAPTTTSSPPTNCSVCPGVMVQNGLELQECNCPGGLWWTGEDCKSRAQCPCFVGHISYAIGASYEEEDCSQCVCKLGGVSHCTPKKCKPCPTGLKSTVSATCSCTCKACPEDTVLCTTSNICINSTLWCNGIQDCPDDEVNCPTIPPETTTLPTTTLLATTKKPIKKCPVVQCQPGYRRKELKKAYSSYLSPMISINQNRPATKSYYTGRKTATKTSSRPKLIRPVLEKTEETICKEYKCVSNKPPPKFIHTKEECPPIVCQANYIPIYDFQQSKRSKECPTYSCFPPPQPDAVCNVTGRTFNTFDNTEYKYDICNHVLARDLDNDEWDVSLKKNCNVSCSRDLIVRHQQHLLVMHPDLSVEFDGYKYSVDQTKKIGDLSQQAFSISQLGSTMLFASNRYGFWVVWNRLGNVKLGVVYKLVEKVDGLCGFFNELGEDDKRKPDGALARTTVEFGDSWALASDQPVICETKACPIHVQNQAWEMCNKIKDQTLSPCARVVDIEAFVSRCLESTCSCLEAAGSNHSAEEECRCQTMQSFVVDCLTADATIDLSDWRMQHDCPASCDAPLVYHDCYQRKCEPTCQSISDPNVCPKLPNVCFPGCYCPPGHVRKGDTCIKPSSCRDCECNLLPHLQYVTYDESNFTITGTCVYVMSRDVLLEGEDKHKFQVLITNHPCDEKPKKTCIGKITILYDNKKIHVIVDQLRNKLKLIVDGERISDLSEVSGWSKVRETATKHFKILLTDIQVEVSVYYPSLGVSVKAPSHKYGGMLEGLCGDCNGDLEDDFKLNGGGVPKDLNDFTTSWLYEHLPGGQNKDQCKNQQEEECPPLPIEQDPCIQLVDQNKFGQCLNVLDPMLFVEWCRKDTCGNHPDQSCSAIEAYARDCASAGFCVNWRNELCPAKTCPADQTYDPCGSNCPKTCQNVKDKKKANCKEIPVEGCFCDEGKVLLNGTCVLEKDCEVCDEQGHHPGDQWQKDKCTSCTCEGTSLKCETQHCEGDKVCERGFNALKLPSKDSECCDKYVCVPEPTAGPTCETPQKLLCGEGQRLKLNTKPNGCQTFICECKPLDECDPIDDGTSSTSAPLQPGQVREVDDSGCCPVAKIVCKEDLCPPPQTCPQYHTLKEDKTSSCCPLYSCEAPKDKCIFETAYAAATKGGERLQTRYEKQSLLKQPNETWQDGPCRQCTCSLTSFGNYQPYCSKMDCGSLEVHPDYLDYELQRVDLFEECCPTYQRFACLYEGKTYKLGDSWTKPSDHCVSYQCASDEAKIVTKERHVETCKTSCELGFEYQEPEASECCGSCKQIACVVEGTVYKVGEEWTSKDFCVNYFCLNVNGSMQVQSVKVACPELPPDFVDNFEYTSEEVPGQCCKNYKMTACKVAGKTYKIGESWLSPDGDKCKSFTCVEKTPGELTKQEIVETCKTDCSKGWKYVESNTTCCGECVQIACLVDDELKTPGENWTSLDGCTTFVCDHFNDQFVVSSQQESCPSLEDCPEENIYVKGCCKHCNITSASQVTCAPEAIPGSKTIGLITGNLLSNGRCVNKKEIPNFTECVGSCHSSTAFNIKSGMHESVCSCCQATQYESLEVEMICEDGYVWIKKVAVPKTCGCEGCSSQTKLERLTKQPSKSKTFTKH